MTIGRLGDPSAVRSIQIDDDLVATYVVDGILKMRPDAFFPDVPSSFWSARPERLSATGDIVLSAGGLLIERAGQSLLVDVGNGPLTMSFEFGSVESGALLDVLESIGRNPEDIDVVAFTICTSTTSAGRSSTAPRLFPMRATCWPLESGRHTQMARMAHTRRHRGPSSRG